MTMIASTGRTETRPCSSCNAPVEHREGAVLCGHGDMLWSPERHFAPCGLACIGGGVKPAQIRANEVHGYSERCPKCGPLRVLPEVVEEMRLRGLAAAGTEYGTAMRAPALVFNRCVEVGNDLLRALNEIEKLNTEKANLKRALDESRERATSLEMEAVLVEERAAKRGGKS